jgi:catechol 2,3-dioxygenase-like lactoylglutathione lyase family enzyme
VADELCFRKLNNLRFKSQLEKQFSISRLLPPLVALLQIHFMVTKLSHASFFVNDQDKAYDFYVNKLGFKVNTDATMDNGFRWLTVSPPEQPEMEIVLFPANGDGSFDDDVKAALKLLLDKGVMGAGVLQTNNCRATYEELKAKGVQFKSEPKEQFYGVEAVLTDGCGNWFSMTEPK